MNADYLEYMQSEQWAQLKETHADPRECVACYATKALHLHHMHYPENIWDTQPGHCCWLCIRCHEMFHRAVMGERKKYQAWATDKNRTVMLINAQRKDEGMEILPAIERILNIAEAA